MANLLERVRDERSIAEGGKYLVKLRKENETHNFDLVGKLREGSLVYADSKIIHQSSGAESFRELQEAQRSALVFAQASGFDYALVEWSWSDQSNMPGSGSHYYLAQFYVARKG